MDIALQPELDNGIKQEINSIYKIINVQQQGSLPSFNNSKNQILIEIPSNIVFNPSLVTLSFTRGVSNNATLNTYNSIPSNYIPYFSRCELYSSNNNIMLVNVQNLDIYNKLSSQLYDSFLDNQDNYNYSSVRTTTNNSVLTSDYFYDSGSASDRFLTYSNYEVGAISGVLPSKVVNIKLCDLIPMSFFSINKNIYSSSVLYLRLETNNLSNIMFNFGATSNLQNINGSESTSLGITNLSLNIYCEGNSDLINIIRQQQSDKKEGHVIIQNEISNAQYSLSNSAGTRGSIIKIVNNGNSDSRLYMVLCSLTNTGNATSTYTIHNSSNLSNLKYNSVQLYKDSDQILNFDTTLNQDLAYIDNMFENNSFNSTISYKNISPFVYCFSTKKITNSTVNGNLLDGCTFQSGGEISLNITYNMVAPLGNASTNIVNSTNQTSYNHNIFTIVKKRLYMKDGRFSNVPFN